MSDNEQKDTENAAQTAETGEQAPTQNFITKDEFSQLYATLRKENAELKKMLTETHAKPKAPVDEEKITLSRRLEQLEKERAEEKEQNRQLKALATAQEALTQNNVANEFMKPAINHLKAEGRIKHDEQGQLVFVDQYGLAKDFHSGIKEWSNSAEGKIFQAPKGAKGGGDRAHESPAKSEQTTWSDIGQALIDLKNGTLPT